MFKNSILFEIKFSVGSQRGGLAGFPCQSTLLTGRLFEERILDANIDRWQIYLDVDCTGLAHVTSRVDPVGNSDSSS
jgi:hypothetical protein